MDAGWLVGRVRRTWTARLGRATSRRRSFRWAAFSAICSSIGTQQRCIWYTLSAGWPLVWKTWKCQRIWQRADACLTRACIRTKSQFHRWARNKIWRGPLLVGGLGSWPPLNLALLLSLCYSASLYVISLQSDNRLPSCGPKKWVPNVLLCTMFYQNIRICWKANLGLSVGRQ